MNLKNKILLTAAVVIASFTTSVSYAQSSSITLGVDFGVRQLGGGECVGRGICDMYAADGGGVNVQFATDPNNSGVLVLTFSASALRASQPSEVALFLQANGSYPFDNDWTVPSNIASALSLSSGATVSTSSSTVVVVDGDVITAYFTLSY
jgi:hypothetical protein